MNRLSPRICILMAALLATGVSAQDFQEAPEAVHDTIACNHCHLQSDDPDHGPHFVAERRCRSCHLVRSSERGPFHAPNESACLGCHSYHEPGRIVAGDSEMALADLRSTSIDHCRSCHAAEDLTVLSTAHRDAAAFYHGDTGALVGTSPSQGCVNCHVREMESEWRAEDEHGQLTFYDHASHARGVRVVPGSGRGAARIQERIDTRIPLFDDRIECQTCHSLMAETRFQLIAFEEKDGLCLGCHKVGPEPKRVEPAVAMVDPGSR